MTLTETAAATKRWLKLTLIFGSIFLVVWLIYLYVYNHVYVPYQKSQVKAEQRFGILPKPKFPPSLASSSAFEYVLDTQFGGLPNNIPKLLDVYFVKPQETTLLAPDRARKLAASFDFTSDPQILSPSEYRYTDHYGGQMTIELSTGNFTLKRVIPPTSGANPNDIRQDQFLPPEDFIVKAFTDYLSSRGLDLSNFKTPRGVVSYDNPNRQLAQTAKVSIWSSNIGDIPIVTDNPNIGPISGVYTTYQNEDFRFSEINYNVWSIDSQTHSTYIMNPISQAFQDLKDGKGIVVKNNTKDSRPSITKIYPAFYMSAQYQPFLEPVYVFEGDDFIAYIEALTPQSYAK